MIENLQTGYVRLYRSWLKSSIWTMPMAWNKLAMACLLMANYKPGKWWDGNETIIIPAGSFITSERNLAKTVKITQKQIRGGLRALERDQFISVQRAQRWTMISV